MPIHSRSFAAGGSTSRCLAPTRLPPTAISRTGKMAGQQGGGIGGAMDLAACAKHVFIAMEHQTRNGAPRLVERCTIPATARGVVNLVVTNFGLFEITKDGMALKEIAPGVTIDEVQAATGCALIIPPTVPPVRMRA